MIVSAKRGTETCEIIIDPVSVIAQLRDTWVWGCGQSRGDKLAECGYWQKNGVNIRLATKEEIAQNKALIEVQKLTIELYHKGH